MEVIGALKFQIKAFEKLLRLQDLHLPLFAKEAKSGAPSVDQILHFMVLLRYNGHMPRLFCALAVCLCLVIPGVGQSQQDGRDANQNQPPPRSDRDKEAGESSSRDTRIDLSPPKDDAKNHPNSTVPEMDTGDADVQEFHPYDPHKASKDIEVGDFYFRKKNYRAALDRYREALFYKPNDALANFRMAQAFEKLSLADDAVEHYEEYLKVLPNGPLSGEAKKALQKLKANSSSDASQ
jgi:tetratricopeptide (TPR) repeat protein